MTAAYQPRESVEYVIYRALSYGGEWVRDAVTFKGPSAEAEAVEAITERRESLPGQTYVLVKRFVREEVAG